MDGGRYYLNPSNTYIQSSGFNTSTPLIVSNDGGQTPISNVLSNPFPTGIMLPAGSSLGANTFLGQALTVVNPNFILPHVNQFSFGVQYQVSSRSRIDASYVGSRGVNLDTTLTTPTQSIDVIPLSLRKQCDAWEGGTASYCQALIPNPFYQLAPFAGTSYYTSKNLSRAVLSTPLSAVSVTSLR